MSQVNLISTVQAAIGRLPGSIGIGLIRLYRLTLSPFIGRQCRYLPTCSEYTEEAIRRFGLWPGLWIGLAQTPDPRDIGGKLEDALIVDVVDHGMRDIGDERGCRHREG